ncbi:ATP-grasp domain-containing protein [Burkholderia sp. LMG 32019]|uniref:ATP-grasp domain-containing protein n=1 Tax=Burkholderia sp. LMG 32019 TaxID=3158173 RepID=UPI003C2CFDF9
MNPMAEETSRLSLVERRPGFSRTSTSQVVQSRTQPASIVKAEPVDGFIRRGVPRRDSVLRLPRSVASPTPIPVRSTSTPASKPTRAGSARPVALVMLYMAGSERSIAMVCEAGRPAAFVGRRKQGLHQTLENNSAAVELALKAAASLQMR